jgi:shikimate kinase
MTFQSKPRGNGLALVGARGTGKSTVGQLVAERLGRAFVDLDNWIEQSIEMPIGDYFARFGERRFRDEESSALEACITKMKDSVVATGGGIVLSESNRELLHQLGFVVWLMADPEVLAARLEADPRGLANRPALTTLGTLAEIAEVVAVRTPLYRQVANAAIDTTARTPAEVADAVIAAWSREDVSSGGGP